MAVNWSKALEDLDSFIATNSWRGKVLEIGEERVEFHSLKEMREYRNFILDRISEAGGGGASSSGNDRVQIAYDGGSGLF